MASNDLVKLLPSGYEPACFEKKAITRKRRFLSIPLVPKRDFAKAMAIFKNAKNGSTPGQEMDKKFPVLACHSI